MILNGFIEKIIILKCNSMQNDKRMKKEYSPQESTSAAYIIQAYLIYIQWF